MYIGRQEYEQHDFLQIICRCTKFYFQVFSTKYLYFLILETDREPSSFTVDFSVSIATILSIDVLLKASVLGFSVISAPSLNKLYSVYHMYILYYFTVEG